MGLVANPTAVNRGLDHAADLLHRRPEVDLRCLFGPEHGLRGSAQDMAAVADHTDSATGLPVASLYGDTLASLSPAPEQLARLDVLLFDVQDVGARYYTYGATLALCMRAAAVSGVRVVVLDRPNPIGGAAVEGGGLDAGLESFCGLYPAPQRHGMTLGELARLYNETFGIGCELDVAACEGWPRSAYYDQCGLPWVMPSPNMPTPDTALVYPGMVLLEGTNLSEGRGTTRPFEIAGAPWLDAHGLSAAMNGLGLPGVWFRPAEFQPTFQKHAGETCGGCQLHVTDRAAFRPVLAAVAFMQVCRRLAPDRFAWREPPYEYETVIPPIDILSGSDALRRALDADVPCTAIAEEWAADLDAFRPLRDRHLAY